MQFSSKSAQRGSWELTVADVLQMLQSSHGIGRYIVLREFAAGPFLKPSEYSPRSQTVFLNPLTPNDHYSGRTAPLTSKVAFNIFIQQI